MYELLVRTSIPKSAMLMAGCLVFVLGGYLIAAREEGMFGIVIGVICVAFFGLGFFVILWQVLDRQPRILINKEGITDRTLKIGQIDWADIESGDLVSIHGTKFISLRLIDRDKYLKRLSRTGRTVSKLNRSFGFSEINVNLSLIDVDVTTVMEIVEKHIGLHSEI